MEEQMLPFEWTQIEATTDFRAKIEDFDANEVTVITETYENPLQPRLF